jgi:hypothetical protein
MSFYLHLIVIKRCQQAILKFRPEISGNFSWDIIKILAKLQVI